MSQRNVPVMMKWVGIGLFLLVASSTNLRAIDLAKDTAIRLAPEDCDVYVGAMQIQEQWNRFVSSKLYQEMAKVPCVEKFVAAVRSQWDGREGQVGQARQMIDNPNVESLLKLALDMVSDETFLFADGKASQAIIGINSLSEDISEIAASGDQQAILEYFLDLQKSDWDDLEIPTVVFGFKVKDQERVLGKLDELEGIIRFGLGSIPMTQSFVEGLERIDDARGVRISWTVIPEMIPWAQLRRSIPTNEGGQITEKLQELLADRQLCITIGQLDGYLIFALSEDPETISELGKAKSLLTNPDLKTVIQNANKEITSVSYVSDAYSDAYYQTQFKDFFSRHVGAQFRMLQSLGQELPKGFESLAEDLEWIDEQIAELVPSFQGQTAFSFLTKTGSEFWSHSRTENVLFDASKPLDVLEHVGGDPMMLIAFRLQNRPEYFATARRIVRKVKNYLDLIPEMEELTMSDSQREAWEVGLDRGWPLVVELADIWEKQFLPAMKDGQHAWVLHGGDLSSKQWYKDMPESSTPLTIPEIATITGLSNRQGMIDAWKSLYELFDKSLALVRELEPNSVRPDYAIPRPVPAESQVGNKYTLPIPEDCPVPKNLAPQMVLTDRYMISTYSEPQSQSLAASKDFSVAKNLVSSKQACASVSYVDVGRLINFAKPWIAYAIETSQGSLDGELIESQADMPAIKGSDILDIWTALGSAGQMASVTTQADDGGAQTRVIFTDR
jgi:hypothetical protein